MKGGTSLSKGWGLIQRFSEDIDLFLNPAKFEPALGENRVMRKLEELRDYVGFYPGLTWTGNASLVKKARADRYEYATAYPLNGNIPASVLVEAGIRSGDYPVTEVNLASYLSDYLRENSLGEIAEDLPLALVPAVDGEVLPNAEPGSPGLQPESMPTRGVISLRAHRPITGNRPQPVTPTGLGAEGCVYAIVTVRVTNPGNRHPGVRKRRTIKNLPNRETSGLPDPRTRGRPTVPASNITMHIESNVTF